MIPDADTKQGYCRQGKPPMGQSDASPFRKKFEKLQALLIGEEI